MARARRQISTISVVLALVASLGRPADATALEEVRRSEKADVVSALDARNVRPNATVNGTRWKGTVNSGAGNTGNWSNAGNWDSTPPASDERNLFFGQAYKIANGTNYVANNDLSNYLGYRITFDNVTNPVAFTLQGSALTLEDFNGQVARIENQSTANQTLNFAGLQFGGSLNWVEINALNGPITFGSSNTLSFAGSVAGIKLFGNTQSVTFKNTIDGSGKAFALTGNTANTVNINGSVTTGDFYVMNGGTLRLNDGGSLTISGPNSALRLGGDFGVTGNQDQTKGGTFVLTSSTSGQNFSGIINTVAGNTSGALLIDSPQSGNNTISSQIVLDSDLTIRQAPSDAFSRAYLRFQGGSFDIKNRTLTVQGGGLTNEEILTGVAISDALESSHPSGGSLVVQGVLYLPNTGNTYTGTDPNQLNANGTIIDGGTLGIYGDGSLGLIPANAYNNIVLLRNTSTLRADANIVTLDAKRSILVSGFGTFDAQGHVFTINGLVSGAGSIQTNRCPGSCGGGQGGTVRLTNPANSYPGSTTISSGTLEVIKLADGGSVSCIGTGTEIIFNGVSHASSILRYVGSGDSTNRAISIHNTSAWLDASGTGPLSFTNGGTIGQQYAPASLYLTGGNTGANLLASSLTDRILSGLPPAASELSKYGDGQWVLTGTSPYTGPTDVFTGLLTIQNGSGAVGRLSGTSSIVVRSGATLGLAGSTAVSDRLNNGASLTLTNGTLRLDSVPEGGTAASGLGALTLTSNTTSVVDLAGTSLLHFAPSANQTWTGTLSVWNWTGNSSGGGQEQLLFGSNDSSASLTQVQLNTINFYSDGGTSFLGTARFAGLGSGEIIPFPPLAFWRQLQGLPADGSQDRANPSGDGVSNLLKYAFNMAPNAGDLAKPNVSVLAQNGSAGLPLIQMDSYGRLVIEFVRRKATSNPGITYTVETGSDVASLNALDLSAATIVSINSTFERVSVTDPMIVPTRFGRVRVTVL